MAPRALERTPGPPVLRLAPGALLLPLRIREEERGEEGLWLSAQCASLVQQAALKSLRASSREGAGSSHSTRPPRLHPEL